MFALCAVALLAAAPGSTSTSSATAASPLRFGDAWTVSPSGGLGLTYQSVAAAGTDQEPDDFVTLRLSPRVDVFVLEDLAASLSIEVERQWRPGADLQVLGFGAGLAYNLWLTERLSLFPRATVGYWREQTLASAQPVIVEPDGTTRITRSEPPYRLAAWWVRAEVMLLWHFGRFFIGGGPFLQQTLRFETRSTAPVSFLYNRTTVSLATTFGGWL